MLARRFTVCIYIYIYTYMADALCMRGGCEKASHSAGLSFSSFFSREYSGCVHKSAPGSIIEGKGRSPPGIYARRVRCIREKSVRGEVREKV